jgi:hypothetical protein
MSTRSAPSRRRSKKGPTHAGSGRTKLGRTLRDIRREIVDSGAALLDWQQLNREIAQRRADANGEAGA